MNDPRSTRFIFVTGGVASSLGKGITAASIGRLLKSRGFRVAIMKLDPYINVDPGTMNPYQHGEVFVTGDGAETDLDLGHYERFIDLELTHLSSVTAGKIYASVIAKERRGDYRGETVQVIPHVTNEIKSRIYALVDESRPDFLIAEIGGTVGDIESLPFLEAVRQIRHEVGRGKTAVVHVTLVPYIKAAGELKTKPTQHSVKELRSIGIQPTIIVCRADRSLPPEVKEKIALFADIDARAVVEAVDAETPYEVPLLLQKEGLDDAILAHFHLTAPPADLAEWARLVERLKRPETAVEIALVGKYVALHDAYLSLVEALKHAGSALGAEVRLRWVAAEALEAGGEAEALAGVAGILVPGGSGDRGAEGKIRAIRYARETGVPFLGIGLGMQLAAVEYARNVLGFPRAGSVEVDPAADPAVVVPVRPAAEGEDPRSALCLGNVALSFAPGSRLQAAYDAEGGVERVRHRFALNPALTDVLFGGELRVAATGQGRVQAIELPSHPWYVATLYHPEFTSRLNRPNPLIRAFLAAALEHRFSASEPPSTSKGAAGRSQ
ncbi:CTP synthase [Hydrogenibacillus sp. N12]|uniref:CTP synthase n=1 Tax=Hydrogenibacillus sp. N12 TaxID=2866627 RepID=UPI001C7D4B25|nr:CTP synthase [Hydrogenibacillus sp. N12]QZA32977.1 CTP synthase [Hydrogenibacillus sp. N12]